MIEALAMSTIDGLCVFKCCGHRRCACGERMRDACSGGDVVDCPHCGRRYAARDGQALPSVWSLPAYRCEWSPYAEVEGPWPEDIEPRGYVRVLRYTGGPVVRVGPYAIAFDTHEEARHFRSTVPKVVMQAWCLDAGMSLFVEPSNPLE